MTGTAGTLRIGTSGWVYNHWCGPFYPKGLNGDDLLRHYAGVFNSVEINHSFYRLPSASTLRHWRQLVPAEFRFAVKASRYITHMKKLRDPARSLANFLGRVALLGDNIGPILFQMPPRWHFDPQRLGDFLNQLSEEFRYVFEFRDRSWIDRRCYEMLAEHGAAFCIYELDGFVSPKQVTADFVYIRLHGPDGPYRGSYDGCSLSGWAGAISSWLRQGSDVYCYFDNDQAGFAADNARHLRRMLDGD